VAILASSRAHSVAKYDSLYTIFDIRYMGYAGYSPQPRAPRAVAAPRAFVGSRARHAPS